MTKDEANQQIEQKKAALNQSLKAFAQACQEKADNAILFGSVVEAHTALINTINNVIPALNDGYNLFKDQNVTQDLLATVKNFLDLSYNYDDLMAKVTAKYSQTPVLPSPFAYNTIQTFLNSFSSPAEILEIKRSFEDRKISTDGFNNKMHPPMADDNQAKQRKISILVGAISIVIVIAILSLRSNIPYALNLYLRILFAIGCGGISAALLGTFTIDMQQTKGITAAGGFAIFVLIYFFDPVSKDDFSMSIFLRDKANHQLIDGSSLSLRLRLGQNLRPGEYLASSQDFQFNPLPATYLGKRAELLLNDSSKWLFVDDSSRSTYIVLQEDGIDVSVRQVSIH